MATLKPVLFTRNLNLTRSTLLLPGITWEVGDVSWGVEGGCISASITAKGNLSALRQLLGILRCPVEITDEVGQLSWWGFVSEVAIETGTIRVAASLSDMANRVAVAYGSGSTRETTEWAEDAESIAEYGSKELLATLSNALASQAEQKRDALLSSRKYPVLNPSRSYGEVKATILCQGWLSTLDWYYYSQAAGVVSHDVEATGHQKVGKSSYTASTIAFDLEGPNYIVDEAATPLLLAWKEGDRVTVSGSAANSGIHEVLSAHREGEHIESETTLVTEAAGPSITVAPWATDVAQSFLFNTSDIPMTLNTLRIVARKVGTPANLKVSICTDNAGNPDGTGVLGVASITEAEASTSLAWVDFDFASEGIALSPATTYWLVVQMDGTADAENFWEVGVEATGTYASGQAKFWTGAAWENPYSADVPFYLTGTWSAEDQITKIVAESEFLEGLRFEADSGFESVPYRDGDTTALQELGALLESGVDSGYRYLAKVEPDRILRVYREPTAAEQTEVELIRLREDGSLTTQGGARLAEHLGVVVGRWVSLFDIIPPASGHTLLADPGPFMIDRATYNGPADELTFTPRNVREVWEFTEIDEG